MSNTPTFKAGQLVGPGRFTLIKELGRGGMGVVWLAQDTNLGEQVALKFLPPEVAADPAALDDLRRETLRSRRLSHPNIVRIHDLHEAEGEAPFLSMEFVDGPNLLALRVAQPQRVFAWPQLQPWVRQLCAALDYAHGEKVIHRDLKPGNLMVDAQGRLKLADFGIAAVVSDSMSRVSVPRTSGTLAYMSPQQLEGRRAQATDDIYALGATLYELLTSKPPFHTGDVAHQVLHVEPTPLAERLAELELENEIPADVAALVMACLAKEPAQRPQSARAVAEWVGLSAEPEASGRGLAETVGTKPESDSPIATPPAPALDQGRRTRSSWLLWSGAAVVLLALPGLLLLKSQRPLENKAAPRQAARFTNSLGMIFVPVPGTDVEFSIWETRVQDFESFVKATGHDAGNEILVFKNGRVQKQSGVNWKSPGFTQGPTHPVVGVSWNDAAAFCAWLTERDRERGALASDQTYRLPTDKEWSQVLGAGVGTSHITAGQYPWGSQWPPPAGVANLAGEEARDADWPGDFATIAGYRDGFPRTAPVGRFPANPVGLFDLDGNACEWSAGEASPERTKRSVRWAGWLAGRADWCATMFVSYEEPNWRGAGVGFRVVLAGASSAAVAAAGDWITLFDGTSTEAWRGFNRQSFPSEGWAIEAGALKTTAKPGAMDGPRLEREAGSDLVSKAQFKDFALEFEWRTDAQADSGVFYNVADESKLLPSSGGAEMQIVGDGHPQAQDPQLSTGAAAHLFAPGPNRAVRPAGEYNQARLVVRSGQVEHWLNGEKIVEYTWGGQPMRDAYAKLSDSMRQFFVPKMDTYGGHIALQHAYAGTVWYRKIRIRRL